MIRRGHEQAPAIVCVEELQEGVDNALQFAVLRVIASFLRDGIELVKQNDTVRVLKELKALPG